MSASKWVNEVEFVLGISLICHEYLGLKVLWHLARGGFDYLKNYGRVYWLIIKTI